MRPKKIAALFFFCALAVGYSRIYLSQHFLLDVFFGSLIGTIGTLIVFSEAVRFKWISLPVRRSNENP
jgi:membrane-associated phospholipid phosphatase